MKKDFTKIGKEVIELQVQALKKVKKSLGGSFNKRFSESKNNEERTGTQPYIQKDDFNFNGEVITFNTGLDWFPSENNEFSTDISYTNNAHILNSENTLIQNNNTKLQNSIGDHLHKTFSANANYRHLFNKDSHYLEFDAQVSDSKNVLTGNFNPNYSVLDNATNNNVLINNLALDYANKISDKFEIEAGFISTNQNRNKRRLNCVGIDIQIKRLKSRIKTDTIFRDTSLMLMRRFDVLLRDHLKLANDDQIFKIAETRTGKAFLIVGKLSDSF